jgi:hypothetical protein
MNLINRIINKIFNKDLVNKKYLETYLHSEDVVRSRNISNVVIAYLQGYSNLSDLQNMFPDITRERIRQLLMKAERIGRKVNEK